MGQAISMMMEAHGTWKCALYSTYHLVDNPNLRGNPTTTSPQVTTKQPRRSRVAPELARSRPGTSSRMEGCASQTDRRTAIRVMGCATRILMVVIAMPL
ncbi:hypothetical protein PGT21_024600 [Puccinia graminis f. sp. tritici]|uniref:Uncharacterized protein n=1 Tax=Puccinia graminis f. sp. tritici TaxID=56615 RepID=A0A5B0MMD7_PUCGR|nr:hypothetical protein PGT21_024600 [Puccinia graminis f. sp. tritici]